MLYDLKLSQFPKKIHSKLIMISFSLFHTQVYCKFDLLNVGKKILKKNLNRCENFSRYDPFRELSLR